MRVNGPAKVKAVGEELSPCSGDTAKGGLDRVKVMLADAGEGEDEDESTQF